MASFAGFAGASAYFGLCGYCYAAEDATARTDAYGLPKYFTDVDPRTAILPALAIALAAVAAALDIAARRSGAKGKLMLWLVVETLVFGTALFVASGPTWYALLTATILAATAVLLEPVVARLASHRSLATGASSALARDRNSHGSDRPARLPRELGGARPVANYNAWALIAVLVVTGPLLAALLGKYVGYLSSTTNVELQITSDRALCPAPIPDTNSLCVILAFNGSELATRWINARTGQLGATLLLVQQPADGFSETPELFPSVHAPRPIPKPVHGV